MTADPFLHAADIAATGIPAADIAATTNPTTTRTPAAGSHSAVPTAMSTATDEHSDKEQHMPSDADRIRELEATLKDVLSHIRPQGHADWELNTCLVTNEELAKWWKVLGATIAWTPIDHYGQPL